MGINNIGSFLIFKGSLVNKSMCERRHIFVDCSNLYLVLKFKTKMMYGNKAEVDERTLNEINKAEYYISIYESIMSRLSKEDRTLLENDFLKPNIPHDWWKKIYSRSTYYRYREHAISTFLNYAF